MATIQWFPGHMSKARRQVQENIKHVDFVTILVDARLPLSSQNPMLTKIVGDKPKLMILNKADLADSNRTKEWRKYFESQGIKTLAVNSKEQSTVKLVTEAAKSLMADKLAKLRERGIQKETLRTMIIGIPNAGKSTLMNILGCLDRPSIGSYKLDGEEVAHLSDDECDLATRQFVDWYISEQVEEEANARNVITKLKMFGDEKASLYHLDKELGEREYKAHKYRE